MHDMFEYVWPLITSCMIGLLHSNDCKTWGSISNVFLLSSSEIRGISLGVLHKPL